MSLSINKYHPRPSLRPYIKFYYLIRTDDTGDIQLDNHPQGDVDLIFTLDGEAEFKPGKSSATPLTDMFVVAQQNQSFQFSFKPNTRLLGITFQAPHFGEFFKLPMPELANTGVSIEPEYGFELKDVVNQFQALELEEDLIFILEEYLTKKLERSPLGPNLSANLLPLIQEHNGVLSVGQLEQMAGYSTRTLQRKFQAELGISPKSLLQIVRFNALLAQLKQGSIDSWSRIVYDYGYFDQAHFIKDFKRYTSKTPTNFLQSNTTLSDFFLNS